jgi:hypothetical protein
MAQPPDFGYDQLKKMIRARDFRIANFKAKMISSKETLKNAKPR